MLPRRRNRHSRGSPKLRVRGTPRHLQPHRVHAPVWRHPTRHKLLSIPQSCRTSTACTSAPIAVTSKTGSDEGLDSRKSLKKWSGRRDSNPRRPAWESQPGLRIQKFSVYAGDLRRWQAFQFQQVGSVALLMEPFWSQADHLPTSIGGQSSPESNAGWRGPPQLVFRIRCAIPRFALGA